MGKKSDKKIKSDRINVLRKQYDSFLEEDKKRKDRNEYILGKLDKMRYSSTAIQLRHKSSSYGDFYPPPNNRQAYRPDHVERNDMRIIPVNQQIARPCQSLAPDVPRNFETSSLLKEISKKYILIPKLRTMYPNDYAEIIPPQLVSAPTSTKPEDIDNNDWKSKYDILEQLKMKENEEEIQFTNKELKRKNNLDRPSENDYVMQNYKTEDLPLRYEEEIPEKDVSDQLLVENELKSLEKCTINENKDEISSINDTQLTNHPPVDPGNVAIYYDDTPNKVIDQNVNENEGDYYQPEQYDIPAESEIGGGVHIDTRNDAEYQEKEYSEQEFQQQNYPVEYEQMPVTEADTNFVDPEAYIEQAENEYSPIEVINPTELVQEINQENAAQVQAPAVTEDEYPVEIINTPDFTPDEAVLLQDGQNVNPNYETNDVSCVQENITPQTSEKPQIDNSGIEEFDAEQQNMFYSEQPDQNFAYDQQGAGNAYNQDYGQNENYPQTQEYAYYEGAEQETYPAEINEHEETQQNYDQHYEQQYTTNYEPAYEQNQVYMEQDPTQQQFEQPAIYEKAQQEFNQYNFDQPQAESKEQVEQVLDGEDGYTPKQNVEDGTDRVPEKLGDQSVEQNIST